jgi:hypothetical protein
VQIPKPDSLHATKAVRAGGVDGCPQGILDVKGIDQTGALFAWIAGDGIEFIDQKLNVLSGEIRVDQGIIGVDALR